MNWVTIGEWKEEGDDAVNFVYFKLQCNGASIRVIRDTRITGTMKNKLSVVFECRLDEIQDKVLDNR